MEITLPASLRIIKIVKDPMSGTEAYTLEFEVETENSKELLKEITASPYGERLIQLLNQADFLPEQLIKTEEELKAEAKKEEEEIEKRQNELKEEGAEEGREELLEFIEETFGKELAKDVEGKYNKKKEKEKKDKIVLVRSEEETREPEY